MDTKESAANSARWSGKETRELASEGEAETIGGSGEVRMTPTSIAEGPEGSGA